ncbi:MAG: DedA family protein [Pseudomonadota bacterium]
MQIDTHEIWQQLLTFMREYDELIEVIMFILAFAESIIFASVFVPSSVIFVAVGALEGAANGPLVTIIIAGALGALAGDIVSFAIGVRLRDKLPDMWPLTKYPGLLTKTREQFDRWGVWAIVASKLLGPLRPILPMLAGASYMSWSVFIPASALSSIIWSALLLAPAYYGLQLFIHTTS